MTFPVQVGPSTITNNRDDRVLICHPDGRILGEADGFFTRDTRFISGYDVWINGRRPIRRWAPVRSDRSRPATSSTNDVCVDPDGVIERQSLALRLDRTIADGVHEDYDLENFSRRPTRLTIEIAIVSDFADIFDVKRAETVRRGQLNTRWFRSRRASFGRRIRTAISGASLVMAVERAGALREFANGRLIFDVTLPPKGAWHTCLEWFR